MKIAADYWVGIWTTKQISSISEITYIIIYCVLNASLIIVGIIRSVFWSALTTKIAINTFTGLLKKTLKKPMLFFNTTPMGQILSLMGKDTDIIDNYLPELGIILFSLIGIFLATLILTLISNIILIIFIIPLILLLFFVIRTYLNLNQELKRLELQAYSPLISNILEVYDGLSQFRSFNKLEFRERVFEKNVNFLNTTFIHQKFANNYVMLYSDLTMDVLILISYGFIFCSFIYNWAFVPRDLTFLSVSLSWVVNIPNFILFFAFMYTEYVQTMGSFERILLNVDPQVNEGSRDAPLPIQENFPSSGVIKVHNIKCRYRDNLPLVLNGLSFEVLDKQKIAIVGRTGSGKSSLMLALTRLLNVENTANFPQIAKWQGIEDRKNLYAFPDKKEFERRQKGNNLEYIKMSSTEINLLSTNQENQFDLMYLNIYGFYKFILKYK